MRRFVLTALLVILAVLSVGTATTEGRSPRAEPAFEVLVVGTLHAPWQFRSRTFHPGHVRAALEAAKPDVVGVESNPTWFAEGKFHVVTYEAQGVAVPWATARKVPVYGIDWMDIGAWEKHTAPREKKWADNLKRATGEKRFGGWAFGKMPPARVESLTKYFSNPDFDFGVMNDIGGDAYGRRWLKGAGDPGSDTFGGRRNRAIVERCVEVMKAHPGKRLVVVIGAGHKAVLDAIFSARPDVRLLRWEKDVEPPTDTTAGAALTDEDRMAIAGHNLDGERSYFHPELIDLDRMDELVTALEKSPSVDRRIGVYFRARLHAHRGEADASRTLLERIRDGKAPKSEGLPGRPYPFPMGHWRMQYDLDQTTRLELARRLLDGDDAPRGRGMLRKLADEMPAAVGDHGRRWQAAWLAKRYPLWLIVSTK